MILVSDKRKVRVALKEALPGRRVTSEDDLSPADLLRSKIPFPEYKNYRDGDYVNVSDEELQKILDWGEEYAFVYRTGSKHETMNPNGYMKYYLFLEDIL